MRSKNACDRCCIVLRYPAQILDVARIAGIVLGVVYHRIVYKAVIVVVYGQTGYVACEGFPTPLLLLLHLYSPIAHFAGRKVANAQQVFTLPQNL